LCEKIAIPDCRYRRADIDVTAFDAAMQAPSRSSSANLGRVKARLRRPAQGSLLSSTPPTPPLRVVILPARAAGPWIERRSRTD
jgi:hypothetical protein